MRSLNLAQPAYLLFHAGTFRPFNATEQPLAKEATSYWTSFARSCDPSTYKAMGSPQWPAGPATRLVIQEGNSTSGTASMVENVSATYISRCSVCPTIIRRPMSETDAMMCLIVLDDRGE